MRKLSKLIITICMVLSLCAIDTISIKAECSHHLVLTLSMPETRDCLKGWQEIWVCDLCGSYSETRTISPVSSHTYDYANEVFVKASFTQSGKHQIKCKKCDEYDTNLSFPKVSSTITLQNKKYVYDGNAHNAVVSKVQDVNGGKLFKGTDYTVTNNPTHTAIGVYNATIQLQGNYTGSKKVYYAIVPKAVTSKIKLSAYNAVKVSWSKVSGATGYRVYYRKYGASSWKYKDTTGTSKNITGLAGGTKYQFKVCPYITGSGGTKYINTVSASVKSTTTLKKIGKPAIYKYKKGKVKVRWKNISGETGYQISRSTSSTKTNVVATIKTTTGDGKLLTTTEGKKYYYKVRSYKTVGDKKVYGPWSVVKAYTCGKTSTSGYDKADPMVKAALSHLGESGSCETIERKIVTDFIKACWNGDSNFFYNSKNINRQVTTPMPGDIVEYDHVAPSGIAHVAVYIGNGKCVHGNWGNGTAQIGPVYISGSSKPRFYRIK